MTRPCILTVEDDAAIRRGIVDSLRFAGYDTIEAADGQSGLEMVAVHSVKLVLPDFGKSAMKMAWTLSNSRETFVRGGSRSIG